MKKEELRLGDQLSNFQRLLALNYARTTQIRFCLVDNKLEEFMKTEKARLEELRLIEQEWEKLSKSYHKKHMQKLRNTQPLNRQAHVAKHQSSQSSQKERYLFSIKSIVKSLASHSEQKTKPKISIKDMVLLYRKVEEDGIVMLMPIFNKIAEEQVGSREPKPERSREKDHLEKFDQISNKLSYNISLLNLHTGIVCNFFMKIDNYTDLESRIKSSDFELELYAFNFHSLFEPTLNCKAVDMSKTFYLNVNNNTNTEIFNEFLAKCKEISVQLSVSKFEYFNQLTAGCRTKIEDIVITSDFRMYYLKVLEIVKRYVDHGLASKYYACNTCSKIGEVKEDGSVVYPVYNMGKEFYHERCLNNLQRNHASQQ